MYREQSISVVSGTSYTISGAFYRATGATGTGALRVGTSTGAADIGSAAFGTTFDVWQTVSFSFTASATMTYYLSLYVTGETPGDVCYFDGLHSSTALVIDLGSAQTVTALLVQDHNLDSIAWQANTSNAWSSPAYQIAASSNDPSVLYPSETYRYWRLVFTTGATTSKIGGLYVGTHLELSDAMSAHTSWGSSVTKQLNVSSKAGDAGELWRQLLSVTRAFDLTFDTISNSDADSLETMFDALVNLTTRVISPLWVHYFYDVEASCRLCHWINGLGQTYRYVDVNQVVMSLQEVARTRACD